jgi:hypothetical protein
LNGADHDQVPEKGIEQFLMADVLEGKVESRENSLHRHIPGLLPLFTETEDMDVMLPPLQASQFPGEVFDVDSGPPVDMGWIFIRQEDYFHSFLPWKTSFEIASIIHGLRLPPPEGRRQNTLFSSIK